MFRVGSETGSETCFLVGSGSVTIFLDPDPKLGGKWDPDPKKIVTDPEHWYIKAVLPDQDPRNRLMIQVRISNADIKKKEIKTRKKM
jgi:hypothetical protein